MLRDSFSAPVLVGSSCSPRVCYVRVAFRRYNFRGCRAVFEIVVFEVCSMSAKAKHTNTSFEELVRGLCDPSLVKA